MIKMLATAATASAFSADNDVDGDMASRDVLRKVARARYPRGPRRDITVVDPPGSRFCEVMSHLRTHLLHWKTHLSHYRAVSSGGDVPGETHLGSREMR